MMPSGGSGVSFVIPASSSALLFAHAEWPSREYKKTGRSGTSSSRMPLLARAPGPKDAIDQPPPSTQGRSGFACAYSAMRVRYSGTVSTPFRSQADASTPPEIGWMWIS